MFRDLRGASPRERFRFALKEKAERIHRVLLRTDAKVADAWARGFRRRLHIETGVRFPRSAFHEEGATSNPPAP